MEYPQLKREQKKNCKLSDKTIAKIQVLFKQGRSMRSLGKQFEISKTTVKYWVNEEFQKKDKEKAMIRTALKRQTVEGKILENAKRAASIKEARHNIEELKTYHSKEKK
jgi:hypothetical protein